MLQVHLHGLESSRKKKHWRPCCTAVIKTCRGAVVPSISASCAAECNQARQTRFIVFALATYSIWVRAGSHYSLLANGIYALQIYGVTAIKSGRVIARKAISVEVSCKGSGRWCETVNLVCLACLGLSNYRPTRVAGLSSQRVWLRETATNPAG